MDRFQRVKTGLGEIHKLSLANAIVFEVMDKEWPLWFVLLSFLGVGVVGMLVCRRRPTAAILILACVVFAGFRQVLELNDPYVGPAMRDEAGLAYFVLSYASIGAGIFLPIVGMWQGFVRRKNRSSSTTL